MTLYEKRIQDRTWIRYMVGLAIRWVNNLKYGRARRIARKNGAEVGVSSVIPMSLAKKLNDIDIPQASCISEYISFKHIVMNFFSVFLFESSDIIKMCSVVDKRKV